jgi:hypothetical protein
VPLSRLTSTFAVPPSGPYRRVSARAVPPVSAPLAEGHQHGAKAAARMRNVHGRSCTAELHGDHAPSERSADAARVALSNVAIASAGAIRAELCRRKLATRSPHAGSDAAPVPLRDGPATSVRARGQRVRRADAALHLPTLWSAAKLMPRLPRGRWRRRAPPSQLRTHLPVAPSRIAADVGSRRGTALRGDVVPPGGYGGDVGLVPRSRSDVFAGGHGGSRRRRLECTRTWPETGTSAVQSFRPSAPPLSVPVRSTRPHAVPAPQRHDDLGRR